MLIGFVGQAGAGKDSAAGTLPDLDWEILKFAAPLKRIVQSILLSSGTPYETAAAMIEGNLKDTPCPQLGGRTPRYLTQTLGTEWGRKLVHPDIWVMMTERRISAALAEGLNVAVTDVRFENEVALIRKLGGKLVRITRPGLAVDMSHESERYSAEIQVDGEIVNDGTLEDLADSTFNQIARLTIES